MPHYQVSKLKSNPTGLPVAGEIGWKDCGFETLGILAANLDCASDFPAAVFVDAVPDMWGKALVFGYALGDPGHSFHQEAAGAFRGFLYMLAMRARLGYAVTTVQVSLDQATHRFVKLANELKPDGAVVPSVGWKTVHVILLDDEVVGITSPLTSFAPREGLDLRQASIRGLADGFRFTDPLPRIDSRIASDLFPWVEQLGERLFAMAAPTKSYWYDAVSTQVEQFKTALKAKSGDVPAGAFSLDDNALALPEPYRALIGRALSRTVRPSDFELIATGGFSSSGILIIDMDAPATWGVGRAELHVHGGLMHAGLNDGMLRSADRSKLGTTDLGGKKWMFPHEFLLDKLTVVEAEQAFRDSAPVQMPGLGKLTPLLPVRAEFSSLLSADDILANSRFQAVHDGIEFVLDLPVGQHGRRIQARRTYGKETQIRIELQRLGVCEVWPGVRMEGWKKWFTYSALPATGGRQFIVRRTDAGARLGATMGAEGVVEETSEAPSSLSVIEITAGADPEYRGLILPKYGNAPISASANFAVGFDFGTTSTQIYLRSGDRDPEPLTLRTPTLSVGGGDPALRLGAMHRFFVPPGNDNEKAPFLSLLRRRTAHHAVASPLPISQAHVVFYRDEDAFHQLSDTSVHSYLKWSSALNADRQAFLAEFALLATFEAIRAGAKEIQFRYSYPIAFSAGQREWMGGAWTNIITMLKGTVPTGVEVNLAADGLRTESICAAQFFSDSRVNQAPALLHGGSIVIDIGGGTSDISVWKDNGIVIQTSMRWSGREILLNALERDRAGGEYLLFDVLQAPASFKAPLKLKTGDQYFRHLDALLRSNGNNLGKLVDALGDPRYKKLRSYVSFALGGMLFYTGILLRARGFEQVPRLFVGGNGCRILHWLAPPVYTPQSDIHVLFQRAIHIGASLPGANVPYPALQLSISPHPKAEAAYGLVLPTAGMNAAAGEMVVSGEIFAVNGTTRDAAQPLLAEALIAGTVTVQDLTELGVWLETYNQFARETQLVLPVADGAVTMAAALAETCDWCASCQGKAEKELSMEPLFIMALRSALRQIHWVE